LNISYHITPKAKAIELFNAFLLINPYEKNALLRRRIAKESALKCLIEINKYRIEQFDFSLDDGFWNDVEEILKKI
jgi:hypothetical protein